LVLNHDLGITGQFSVIDSHARRSAIINGITRMKEVFRPGCRCIIKKGRLYQAFSGITWSTNYLKKVKEG
jgi:hypothetical protein